MTVALAASIIALTSCASDDDASSDSDSAATMSPAGSPAGSPAEVAPDDQIVVEETEAPAQTDAPAAADEAAAETTVVGAAPAFGEGAAAPEPDRLLIVEVTVGVEVADVGKAVTDVIAIGDRYDAQVYGSDVRLSDPEASTGSVIFKLPPQNVEAMIAEASALGRQVSRLQNTDDVTDRMTDINTRIITAQQSVDRLQRLLVEAKDLGEVVLLEGELTARQTVLEELLAQERNLSNQTALATLTLTLSSAPVGEVVVVDDESIDPKVVEDAIDISRTENIGDAFAQGGTAFLTAGAAVLIFIGYTAPFLVVALIVGWIWWIVNRRRARRSRSAAPLLPPAPDAGQQTTEPDSVGAARN